MTRDEYAAEAIRLAESLVNDQEGRAVRAQVFATLALAKSVIDAAYIAHNGWDRQNGPRPYTGAK